MTAPRRRQSDKWVKFLWVKLSILVLVLGAVVTLMTNLFGNKIQPEVNDRLVKLETSDVNRRVRDAETTGELKNMKELMLKIEKKVDRLLYRRNGSNADGRSGSK